MGPRRKLTSKGVNRLPRLCDCGGHGFAPLNDWNTALFDADDLPIVSGRAWSAYKTKKAHTVYVRDNCQPRRMMHRAILSEYDTPAIDHKNHDGCDNRRGNLRPCSDSQNNANRRSFSNSVGLRGVHERSPGRFRAQVSIGNRPQKLGTFSCRFEAARAYDSAAVEIHGEFAITNAALGLLPVSA